MPKRGFDALRQYLRRSDALRIGPMSLIITNRLEALRSRLRMAEAQAALGSGPASLEETATRTGRNSAPRSILFVHNAYYNFFYLARALRARGWDALTVSIEDPSGPNAAYYHGEDVNLYNDDPRIMNRGIEEFQRRALGRFKFVHFYGRGNMSLFPLSFDHNNSYTKLPLDFLKFRMHGAKIGYTVNGCLDGVAQSSVHKWSGGACDKCVWQRDPGMCSDRGNLAWGHKVDMFVDLIASETFPALDYQSGEKCFREPLTTALDPEMWRPDLEIPTEYRLPKAPGELIIFHAVGNYDLRTRDGRNLKGTPAVIAAVERLRAEGNSVRLEFVTGLRNTEVRYIQAQADIIVDQLNYGRYGATAREGMMLGKTTVCRMVIDEPSATDALQSLRECPLVSADETTIYQVLKDLIGDPERRRRIGHASREYCLKWHSADACAVRFERVYDALVHDKAPLGVPA